MSDTEFRDMDVPRIGDVVLYHVWEDGPELPIIGGPRSGKLVPLPAIVSAVNDESLELNVFPTLATSGRIQRPTLVELAPSRDALGWTPRP